MQRSSQLWRIPKWPVAEARLGVLAGGGRLAVSPFEAERLMLALACLCTGTVGAPVLRTPSQ